MGTRRASWSSNLSWRGCALLRSKCLPVLSDLYCTILYCTLHYSTVMYCTIQYITVLYSTKQQWNLAFLPRTVPGVTLPPKLHCPSIFVAVKLCLTFVLVSVFIVYRV